MLGTDLALPKMPSATARPAEERPSAGTGTAGSKSGFCSRRTRTAPAPNNDIPAPAADPTAHNSAICTQVIINYASIHGQNVRSLLIRNLEH